MLTGLRGDGATVPPESATAGRSHKIAGVAPGLGQDVDLEPGKELVVAQDGVGAEPGFQVKLGNDVGATSSGPVSTAIQGSGAPTAGLTPSRTRLAPARGHVAYPVLRGRRRRRGRPGAEPGVTDAPEPCSELGSVHPGDQGAGLLQGKEQVQRITAGGDKLRLVQIEGPGLLVAGVDEKGAPADVL